VSLLECWSYIVLILQLKIQRRSAHLIVEIYPLVFRFTGFLFLCAKQTSTGGMLWWQLCAAAFYQA